MKIDFNAPILDFHGKPVKQAPGDDAPDATLGFVALIALGSDLKGGPAEKMKAFRLMKDIIDGDGKGAVDITPEDAAFIKARIGAPDFQTPLVVGRCTEMLNG